MRRVIARLALVVVLMFSGAAALPAPPAQAFTGHHCTISTCRYFTSSYPTAKYYYDRTTCDQWKSLSKTYLHEDCPACEVPERKLHPPC